MRRNKEGSNLAASSPAVIGVGGNLSSYPRPGPIPASPPRCLSTAPAPLMTIVGTPSLSGSGRPENGMLRRQSVQILSRRSSRRILRRA